MMKQTRFMRRGSGALLALGIAAVIVAGTVPAFADPPKGVVPRAVDIVGISIPITENLCDQLSVDYNRQPKLAYDLYCWDELPPPGTGGPQPLAITPKQGCKPISRVPTLADLTPIAGRTAYHCLDFVMGAGPRVPADPATVALVAMARTAITWAVRSKAAGGSDAPASLTDAQLKAIFTCKDTNWKQVGGKAGAIKVYLPQPGSFTLARWEKFMGITFPGGCVGKAPQEDEGTYSGFNSPHAIFIYSIGAYVAQKYHKNAYGANLTGVLALGAIGKVSPVTTAKVPTINPDFPSGFFATVYVLVRGSAGHIADPRVAKVFSAKGWVCTSGAARKDLVDYGFLLLGAQCGAIS